MISINKKNRKNTLFCYFICMIFLFMSINIPSIDSFSNTTAETGLPNIYSAAYNVNDSIDQYQPLWSGGIASGSPDMLAQSFQPSKNFITKIELLVHKTENTQNTLMISIRDQLNGSDLTTVTLNSSNIPDSRDWVEFDIPDIYVTVNKTYYIVFSSQGEGMTFVWWGFNNHNIDSYPKGKAWLYTSGEWTTEGFVIKDWCFKTYGYHSSQPPYQPVILNGPTEGYSWHVYTFQAEAMDPEGDDIRYGWDIDGDLSIDEWSLFYPSDYRINFTYMWKTSGVYPIRVKAEDRYGVQSNFSKLHAIEIINDPPVIPSKPVGTNIGIIMEDYFFKTASIDPEGNDIQFGWDWDGDSVIDEWSDFVSSGQPVNISHNWSISGTYRIQVKARDNISAQSDFSQPLKIIIIHTDNSPPDKPSRPTGPTICKTGISYSFGSVATDSNGDNIFYMFDWDDGSTSSWIGPFSSGQPCNISHYWDYKGSYQVKVKAKDTSGEESVWSDPLSISLPKSNIFTKNNDYCLDAIINELIQMKIIRTSIFYASFLNLLYSIVNQAENCPYS